MVADTRNLLSRLGVNGKKFISRILLVIDIINHTCNAEENEKNI